MRQLDLWHARTHSITTLLACCWGLIAAYSLLCALLVRYNPLTCWTAAVLLIITWAMLERKRWGRLALLGLSMTAVSLFVVKLTYVGAINAFTISLQTLQEALNTALQPHDSPITAALIMTLAVMSFFWLRRSAVALEFENGKRPSLAAAQRIIAVVLVSCWGLAIALAPLMASARKASGYSLSSSISQRTQPPRSRAQCGLALNDAPSKGEFKTEFKATK